MRVGLIDVLEVIFVFCLNIYLHFSVSQALEDDPGEELELQLKIFFEHKEEDFDEFAQRYFPFLISKENVINLILDSTIYALSLTI